MALAVLAAGVVVPIVPPASASQQTVRTRLVQCLTALNGLYVGPVKPRTPQVAILNRKVHAIYLHTCNGDLRVLGTRAGQALFDLSLGVGYYQQYLTNVAFGDTNQGLLRDAQHQIALGRAEAKKALR